MAFSLEKKEMQLLLQAILKRTFGFKPRYVDIEILEVIYDPMGSNEIMYVYFRIGFIFYHINWFRKEITIEDKADIYNGGIVKFDGRYYK